MYVCMYVFVYLCMQVGMHAREREREREIAGAAHYPPTLRMSERVRMHVCTDCFSINT